MTIRWTALARADVLAIHDYLVARNPHAAVRLIDEIDDGVRDLLAFPRLGRPGRRPDTRELVISGTPYIVAYRLRAPEVQILRVLHGARRWPKAVDRFVLNIAPSASAPRPPPGSPR